MSNVFTLDALREETIKRYAPTVIELSDGSRVELKSVLKLKESARKEVLAAIDEIKSLDDVDDADDELIAEAYEGICASVAKVLKLICNTPRKLLAELEHEDPEIKATLYTSVLGTWMGTSQLGEAESSPA